MPALLTIARQNRESPTATLPDTDDGLDSLVILLRVPLEADLFPLVGVRGGADAVPDLFPVRHGGLEGLQRLRIRD